MSNMAVERTEEGWEYKKVQRIVLCNRKQRDAWCAQERQAGWELYETAGDSRIFKRPISARADDAQLRFDPYRTSMPISLPSDRRIYAAAVFVVIALLIAFFTPSGNPVRYDKDLHVEKTSVGRASSERMYALGTLVNSGLETWHSVTLEVELFDKKHELIFECNQQIAINLARGSSEQFMLKCGSADLSLAYDSYAVKITGASTFFW